MNNKFYKFGIVCGRFGHAHNGHKLLFDLCMNLCDTTLVLIGSAQESKTIRNPFSITTRINIINEMYPNIDNKHFIVHGINDLTNEYDLTTDWGKYLKNEVKNIYDQEIDLMVYGNDESRNTWFTPEDLKNTSSLIVPRKSNDISATMIRAFLVTDNKLEWEKNTPISIHKMYNDIRSEIMEVPIYKNIYDKISKDSTIDNFLKIYKYYENEDKKLKIQNN